MKPTFAVSAILLLMAASVAQSGTAQHLQDFYQGTVNTRQETQNSITCTLKENLNFSRFRTEHTVYAGSAFFNQPADCTRPSSESIMTFTGKEAHDTEIGVHGGKKGPALFLPRPEYQAFRFRQRQFFFRRGVSCTWRVLSPAPDSDSRGTVRPAPEFDYAPGCP